MLDNWGRKVVKTGAKIILHNKGPWGPNTLKQTNVLFYFNNNFSS